MVMTNYEITIDGVEYVPVGQAAADLDGMPYRIVRTQNAGVFAGYLHSLVGETVVLKQARRIWYWRGAASLSQLAQSGTSKPEECKFPEPVDEVTLTQVIEVLSVTEQAQKSIADVAIWKV